jgi:HupE / UreJ protein
MIVLSHSPRKLGRMGIAPSINRWRYFLLLSLIILTAPLANAHAMKQVRGEITVGNGVWQGSIWLEAWALYPEDGPKIPPGTPGDPNTAGHTWVGKLTPADHAIMRKVAAEFLSETFQLTLNGQRLEGEYHFPEYTVEVPELKENDAGNALVRIDLQGKLPPGLAGPLALTWQDDEDEPLALLIKEPETREIRIAPRQAPVVLMNLDATGTVSASTDSSLLTWIIAGFKHILPLGVDHIFFILGLFFLQPKWKPLLWQTSAFTLAHSITLAMVVLGVFTISPKIVEPMIALSIAYVGIENLWIKELKPWRVGLVFGLGLLHGMGFASVMKELELPKGQVIQPLVGFNLGVECGQMTVLAAAFALTFWFLKKTAFTTIRKVASAIIGLTGLYWTVERIWL